MYDNITVQKRAERHAENKIVLKDTICITTLVDQIKKKHKTAK